MFCFDQLIYNSWELNCSRDLVLIHVYGTSHVSEESFDVIDDALSRHDPSVVALELDYPRLNSMLNDEENGSGPVFARIIKVFQNRIGSKTGVMPGEEMEYAYNKSVREDRDIALVDQDIRITLQHLKQVRRKEKVKAAFSLLAGLIGNGRSFDVSKIPDQELINELIEEMQEELPEIYNVLMTERNQHITEMLKKVDEENEGDIVAFLGAAHVEKVKEMLNEEKHSQNTVETKNF